MTSTKAPLLSKNFNRAVSANHEHDRRLSEQHEHIDRHKMRARGVINSNVYNLQAELYRIRNKTPFLDDYIRRGSSVSSTSSISGVDYRGSDEQSSQSGPTSALEQKKGSSKARKSSHAPTLRSKRRPLKEAEVTTEAETPTLSRCPYEMMDPHVENKVAAFLTKITPNEPPKEDRSRNNTDIKETPKKQQQTERFRFGQEELACRPKPGSSVYGRNYRMNNGGQNLGPSLTAATRASTADAAHIAQSGSYMDRLRRVFQRQNPQQHPASLDPAMQTRLHNFKVIARKLQRVQDRRAESARPTGNQNLAPAPKSPAKFHEESEESFSSGSDSESEKDASDTAYFKLAF